MLTKTDAAGTTSYVYNTANQLIQMSSPGTVVTFEYDKNGNQKKRTEGTNITTYAYNHAGKLVTITNPDGSTISYTYDGDGRRVSETVGGVTTKFYYDGLLVAKETDVNGATKAEYLYGLGGTPISMTRDGVTYYYVFNAHGDTVALVDSTGTVRATYSYDPWGQVTVISGSTIKNPFLYAGQFGIYHDVATGLDLMQSRYYNSSIQRFMSADEFLGYEDYPLSQNLYIYVHDDPINKVDPDGHDGKWYENPYLKRGLDWLNENVVEPTIEIVDEYIIEPFQKYVVEPIQKYIFEPVANWVNDNFITPIKNSEIGQAIGKFIDDPIGTISNALVKKQEELKRLEEEAKRKVAEELGKAKAVFEKVSEEITKTFQAGLDAIRNIDVKNELAHANKSSFARDPIGSFETLAKVFGFGFKVKSKWDQFTQSQEERRLQSWVPMAELELKMRGIDPSNPDYNELLIESVLQTDETMSIAIGAYGGVRFGRAPSKILTKGAGEATGIITKNGIKIEGFTSHGVDRAIGDGFKRTGVKPDSILDAIKNPLKINDVVTDSLGRNSQRFIGKTAEVVVNPNTGKIISVNPTSSSKAAKLLKEMEGLK